MEGQANLEPAEDSDDSDSGSESTPYESGASSSQDSSSGDEDSESGEKTTKLEDDASGFEDYDQEIEPD